MLKTQRAPGFKPPKLSPTSARSTTPTGGGGGDVVIDVMTTTVDTLQQPQQQPPAPPRKTVYNPHRVLYIVLWINFAFSLLLGVFFAVYVLTQPPRNASDNVIHRVIPFSPSAVESIVQLSASQFNVARLLDVSVCCTLDGSIQCGGAINISGSGLVRILDLPLGARDCRLSWVQQK